MYRTCHIKHMAGHHVGALLALEIGALINVLERIEIGCALKSESTN